MTSSLTLSNLHSGKAKPTKTFGVTNSLTYRTLIPIVLMLTALLWSFYGEVTSDSLELRLDLKCFRWCRV